MTTTLFKFKKSEVNINRQETVLILLVSKIKLLLNGTEWSEREKL